MSNTIWALFRITNDYKQPENDLQIFWLTKPSFEDFCLFFNHDIKFKTGYSLFDLLDKYGDILVKLKDLYNGKRVYIDNDEYRLDEIESDKKLYV